MSQEVTISIALVTRNRPESLRRCLRSWRSQTIEPFEIVVSDDSDEEFQAEVKRIAVEFGAKWINGPQRGLYANRNHVARACLGSHFFSSDDDHEHPKDLLAICTEEVRADPRSSWCLGEVAAWEDIESKGWYLPGELSVTGGSVVPKDRSNCRAWSDGATVFPREIFDDGLYFCEAFRFGVSYLEFGCLLQAVGRRIRVLNKTGVIHHFGGAERSFKIPDEERASWYFAILMLARVYQPTAKNSLLMAFYFFKELIKSPFKCWKSLSWARKAKSEREQWYTGWSSNRPRNSVT